MYVLYELTDGYRTLKSSSYCKSGVLYVSMNENDDAVEDGDEGGDGVDDSLSGSVEPFLSLSFKYEIYSFNHLNNSFMSKLSILFLTR